MTLGLWAQGEGGWGELGYVRGEGKNKLTLKKAVEPLHLSHAHLHDQRWTHTQSQQRIEPMWIGLAKILTSTFDAMFARWSLSPSASAIPSSGVSSRGTADASVERASSSGSDDRSLKGQGRLVD